MPEVFRFFGFSFFFYSREHGPIHIHIEGNNGYAKYKWNGESFEQETAVNIKAGDLKNIKRVIDENADLIIKRWEEYFNK